MWWESLEGGLNLFARSEMPAKRRVLTKYQAHTMRGEIGSEWNKGGCEHIHVYTGERSLQYLEPASNVFFRALSRLSLLPNLPGFVRLQWLA